MSFHADAEVLYRLLISFGIGTVIGLEREYRSKAAGLRTMIMVCLGSTIFTLISITLGGSQNQDRIATAIVSAHLNRLNDFLKAEPNIYSFEY